MTGSDSEEAMSIAITISSASLHYWLLSLPQSNSLFRRLERLVDEYAPIQGLEFALSVEALHDWAGKLGLDSWAAPPVLVNASRRFVRRVLEQKANTVHLPAISALSSTELITLASSIEAISSKIGISKFIVHPDGVPFSSWELLDRVLPSSVRLCVENMDPRKAEFRSLSELERLLGAFEKLNFTFDTSHWLENENDLDNPELKRFFSAYTDRLGSIHFSVPSSRHPAYSGWPGVVTSHYIVTGSGWSIPDSFVELLPKDVIVTIEGLVPLNYFSGVLTDAKELRDKVRPHFPRTRVAV